MSNCLHRSRHVPGAGGTTTTTPTPITPQLFGSDTLPLPIFAGSLRLVIDGYDGPAIRVQKKTSGGTKDIGFDALGNLDTADLLAFAGNEQTIVTRRYNQGYGKWQMANGNSTMATILLSSRMVCYNNTTANQSSECLWKVMPIHHCCLRVMN